jgi:ferredoxin
MNLHLIYFSPTATTRKIVEAVASGFAAEQTTAYDLTLCNQPAGQKFTSGVAIIGIPVYAGRVPEVCLQRLDQFSANQIPTVLIALYGNREYEDALVELRDVTTEASFKTVAAGAFIGEHSYSTKDQPIAAGRPDQTDLEQARRFGQQVAEKLAAPTDLLTPAISGDIPYRDRVPLGGIAPETDQTTCTLCGTCAQVCPTLVVEVEQEVRTRAENCVMCCACVKDCPTSARTMIHPAIQERRAMLVKNCSTRKEPTLFL